MSKIKESLDIIKKSSNEKVDEKIEKILEPHQQRVVVEFRDLDQRIDSLEKFINGAVIFQTLDAIEQDALKKQYGLMLELSDVLKGRIERFELQDKK